MGRDVRPVRTGLGSDQRPICTGGGGAEEGRATQLPGNGHEKSRLRSAAFARHTARRLRTRAARPRSASRGCGAAPGAGEGGGESEKGSEAERQRGRELVGHLTSPEAGSTLTERHRGTETERQRGRETERHSGVYSRDMGRGNSREGAGKRVPGAVVALIGVHVLGRQRVCEALQRRARACHGDQGVLVKPLRRSGAKALDAPRGEAGRVRG